MTNPYCKGYVTKTITATADDMIIMYINIIRMTATTLCTRIALELLLFEMMLTINVMPVESPCVKRDDMADTIPEAIPATIEKIKTAKKAHQ